MSCILMITFDDDDVVYQKKKKKKINFDIQDIKGNIEYHCYNFNKNQLLNNNKKII